MRAARGAFYYRIAVAGTVVAAFGLLGATAAHAAPSASEKSIVAAVKKQQEPSIELLEQVVNINSGTMNFAGVRAVADVFRPHFDALGFQTSWVDGAPFGRAGHLVAERKGKSPK